MSSSAHIASPNFRSATVNDCAHLVLFADMATRRLTSFLWGLSASPGQSAFEMGRNIIRKDRDHFTHFRNWRVAEVEGEVIGGFNGYIIPESANASQSGLELLVPLNELKALVVGSWYISAIAIYPEHQGKGFGKALLAQSEQAALSEGCDRLTLLVGSFNPAAHALYQSAGFREVERRAFIPFANSDGAGDWILMEKDLR